MDNQFTVFFIDDEYYNFIDVFFEPGNQKTIDILPFKSVEEAIESLREADGCDGIILDLGFPQGKMQGKEGLEIIQKEFPGLPVIILTASYESEDIQTAVECIKMGALHYIGKSSLNPVALMEQMKVACMIYLQQRIDHQKINFNKKNIAIPESKIYESDDGIGFAFKLEHVSEPDALNAVLLRDEAVLWHKNFFQALSFSYQQNVTIELIYRKAPGTKKTEVYVLFIVKDKDKNAQKNLVVMYRDISPLFSLSGDEKSQVYFFSELDAKEIKDIKTKSTQFQAKTYFKQQFVSFSRVKRTGYLYSDQNETEIHIPLLDFPKVPEINDFLNLFSRNEINGELSIEFQPGFLEFEEKNILGFITKKNMALTATDTYKSGPAIQNARHLLDNHLSLFECNMTFATEEENSGFHNTFKIGLSNSFDKDPYETSELAEKSKTKYTFNYYTPYSAMATFRLPFPKEGGIPGIQSLNFNTIRMPDLKKDNGIRLGVKNKLGETVPISISISDLRQHLYIMGQTGTGKTTLLKSIIGSLIKLKKGFLLIDPHGDLSDDVLNLVKDDPALSTKLVLLDPADHDCPVKLNFLKYDLRFPEQKSLIVNELFKIIAELYDMQITGGPVFEQFFKYGMLALLDKGCVAKYGFPTFKEFNKFYFDEDFRNDILKIIKDRTIVSMFENAIKMTGESSFYNLAPYITSKLNRIANDHYLSNFVNTKEDNLDFRNVIDEGKILIVKLDKGKLGSENVTLFGQLLVNKFNMAALSRAELPRSLRKDFYVIIDEFQNFSKGDMGSSLSELRKYGIVMMLANQTMWQLESHIANSVLGNVGSLIFFRPGIKDYELLKYYVEPDFNRENVIKLANYNCIARLMVDNIPTDPFIFQTEILKNQQT